MRHGTTVTVSTGDAGISGTQGSPSTDPNVISAGASTDFRSYEQTGYAGARTFASTSSYRTNVAINPASDPTFAYPTNGLP